MTYSGEPFSFLTALVEIMEEESFWMKMVTKFPKFYMFRGAVQGVCVCVRECK